MSEQNPQEGAPGDWGQRPQQPVATANSSPYGQQPSYVQAFPNTQDPEAPHGRDPVTGEPFSDKSKVIAGLLQLFFGWVGAGRWYIGDYPNAAAQLATAGGCGIWSFVDGILMLIGHPRDARGRPLRG